MTYPRHKIINLQQTQYYHCVSRCVRRSFLCGKDHFTGRNYEHRRFWVEQRLLLLAEVFAIDVYAYAVMHNHTHLVLYVNKTEHQNLDDRDILKRWSRVRRIDLVCAKYLHPTLRAKMTENELVYVGNKVKTIKERLCSISWFMSLLNQYIARKANKEDECTGRFWEGRFKSQALLDEKAILACMVYVDLNPIRAGMSQSLKQSKHTSISCRLKHVEVIQRAKLLPVNQETKKVEKSFLHILSLKEYVDQLLVIAKQHIPINRRSLDETTSKIRGIWRKHATQFETSFSYAAGSPSAINRYRKLVRANLIAPCLQT